MRRSAVFILLILCFAQSLFSQADKLFPFAHYNLNNGLAAYNSNTIVQDSQGFIWIGTINGLQRFDGHRFITFRRIPGDRSSISDNYIDHLCYDNKGNLWLVLGNGEIGIFDTRRFTYSPVKLKVRDPRTLKLPRRLIEDSDGNMLYIIFGREITTYNGLLREFSGEHNIVRLPENWRPLSLIENIGRKQYWISTDSGMCVFNKHSRLLSYNGHNLERIGFLEKSGKNVLYQNLLIENSRFWYTSQAPGETAARMNCYDLGENRLVLSQSLLPDLKKIYEIKRILRQANGKIWIGGTNVLMKYDEDRNLFHQVSQGNDERNISFQEINCLFEDRENNIWLTTNNNGLYALNPSNPLFESVMHMNRTAGKPNEGGVISLSHDSINHIIASVWGDGIHIYDSSLNAFSDKRYTEAELKPYTIWSICLLRTGFYWLGLQSGMMIYDVRYGVVRYHNPKMFENRLVRTIAEDKLGNIWLGLPNGGVFKWNPAKGKDNFEEGFSRVITAPGSFIEKITVDSKGFVWICTLMEGVYKLDPVNERVIDHLTSGGRPHQRLLADAATDAFELNDSIMVILTGALNFYNTKTRIVTPVSSADGMPSDIVRSIEKDNRNNLWLGLFNGLCRMNVEKKTFTYYDRNDGMINDNFNYASSTHLPDGRLVFGTTTDFIVFDPDELNSSRMPPDVTITEFKIANRQLNVDSLQRLPRIELGPDQNFITINFSGLTFYNNKWSYYYMLEGLDKEWKATSDINQVSYNYLPSGTYKFKVRTENADGVSSKKITEFVLEVNPPLLKSWWFYSLVILFVAFILYLIDRERMSRKEAIERMRTEIADNLHEEVNTALNKINILSEIARIKAEKDPTKAPEFFEQIHDKSHDMIIAMDDMLWSIAPENDSMLKTIERIREYIDALKSRHSANIDLLVDKKVETLTLNMKLRHDVFVLMKEGIRSVIQAGTKNCKVHIGSHKDGILYTLEIENRGCDLQQLNNLIQQIDLEKKLSAIDATLTSNMHKFTSIFELYVPIV